MQRFGVHAPFRMLRSKSKLTPRRPDTPIELFPGLGQDFAAFGNRGARSS